MPHPKLSSRSLHMATHDDDKNSAALRMLFCSHIVVTHWFNKPGTESRSCSPVRWPHAPTTGLFSARQAQRSPPYHSYARWPAAKGVRAALHSLASKASTSLSQYNWQAADNRLPGSL